MAFGRKSEKTDPDQFDLALEDLETAIAAVQTEDEADAAAGKRASKPRAINRGSLPGHLPRIEEVIEPASLAYAWGGCLHCIGEDRSERLDVIPAQFRVIVTHRPQIWCRACTDGVVQAPAPARLIQLGLPTEATIALFAGHDAGAENWATIASLETCKLNAVDPRPISPPRSPPSSTAITEPDR